MRLADTGEGTVRDALLAGLALTLALAGGALLWREGWSLPSRLDPYLRAGPRHGALELERHLLADHPRGGEVGSLFGALARLGFACAPTEPPGTSACRLRARHAGGRVTAVVVELQHDEVTLQGLAVRMAAAPR